ncbi:peptidyl-prolyl cis-trans isomerase C [Nitrosomonas sp. Nm51]|uniref:peptidyl-prolyl cis-trans isomerase n=1 Tax=Nitrosomonas sp. Nm51 TaxID=133720 RepID=UPI0008D831EC|nr:peptidylprolyl isomerase [Nitrosomonas sp. Nm51]SER36066.1 peptidyl-prolyl cis-trans isomerase C [Nitrosomonas sp. Nm51]
MRLTKLSRLLIIGSFGFVVMTVHAQSTSTMATVNGVAIPQSRLDLMVKASGAQGQEDGPELRKALRENLITEEILTQEAIKKGLDRDPDVVSQIEIARQAALIRALQANYIKNNAVGEDTLKREYDMLKVQMGDKEYKARHILVESESEARDIIANLRKGGNFAKIAEEKSIDDGSKLNGGELNWSPAAAYVRPFAEALAKLGKGELTDNPVHTNFGWHVIELIDTRPMDVPPYEEVKENIRQRVLQREFAAYVQELRGKAKVE